MFRDLDFLFDFIEHLPVGIARHDFTGKSANYYNTYFLQMFGWQQEEISTMDDWFQKAYPDENDRTEVIARWHASRDESHRNKQLYSESKHVKIACKDGSFKWCEIRYYYQGDFVYGVFHDNNKLTNLKERYETILQISNEALFIMGTDNGRLYEYNDQTISFLGYDEEEMLHLDVLDWDKDFENIQEYQKLTSIITERPVYFERIHTRKDGSTYHAGVYAKRIVLDDEARFYITVRDITKEKSTQNELLQAKEAAELAKERLKYALEGASDGLWDWNLESGEIYFSPHWFEMLGYQPSSAFAANLSTWEKFVNPEDKDRTLLHIQKYLNGDIEHFEIEFQMRHKDGHWVDILSRGKLAADDNGEVLKPRRFVGTHVDISERKRHQAQLEHIAHYDTLTNLPNRVLLYDRIHQAIARSRRYHRLVAIAYLDLDGFKVVNDSHGHDIGDKLLIQIADRLKKTLRDIDTFSRLGGDEFVAVIPDLENREVVIPILKRLLDTTSEIFTVEDHIFQLSASIGVTFSLIDEAIDPDLLIRQADQAMYHAKQSGKNRYELFDPEHDLSLSPCNLELKRIQTALEQDEFALHYQPKVNMRSGEVVGVEALIRWQHPEDGLRPPAAFLPIIDSHPFIVEMGDWVMETAMKQIQSWQDEGIHIPISINIHPMQLEQKDFVEKVRTLLQKYPKVKKGHLEFEILESDVFNEINSTVKIIACCQKLGIKFSLDDFGIGYSSLTYFRRLPVQIIKIDRTFIVDMLNDIEDMAIVEGILKLSQTFNRTPIAEGVETIEHGLALLDMGCELAQGYGIAKPMEAQAIPTWLQSWQAPTEWLDT